MPTAKRTALVTGASGLAGGYMLAHLLEQGGWDIVAVSRRKPGIPGDYRHIAVDLLDPADCRTKLGPLTKYLAPVLFGHHGAPGSQRDGVGERQHVLQPRQDRRGRVTCARACPSLSGHQVVRKSPWPLQDADQGGGSAAHAAELLLRPAGFS